MKKLTFLALVLSPSLAFSHDYSIADLSVAHPIAYPTAATAMTGAGYLSITNNGGTDDRLLAIEADFPRVTLHETQTTNDVTTMVHLDTITIDAGTTVTFAPGDRHVMFMGLNGDPFEAGEEIRATLVFENAGRLEIVFKVEELAKKEENDHSNH